MLSILDRPMIESLTSNEIKRYSEFLQKHISIINPIIIVLMGSTAMESLTGIKQ